MSGARAIRRWWVVLLGLMLVGLGGFAWRQVSRQQLAVAGIPPRPALDAWPAELTDRFTQSEQTARGYRHPAAGLAELSRLYHANGFFNEALQCYQSLQALEPGNARWTHLQAGILSEFGRLDEALPLRQRTVQLAPTYLPAHLRLGDVLLKANQPTTAAGAYQEAARREADNPYALLGLARCATMSGDWTRARELLQRAVGLHPGFYGASSLLVSVHEHFGAETEADALRAAMGRQEFVDLSDPWVDDLSEDCFDAYRLSVAAAVARAAGNAPVSRQRLEKAVALKPEVSNYRRQLANQLMQEGKLSEARSHLEAAVATNPADSDAWILLVQNLNGLGERLRAESALVRGLAACPQSPSLHLERGRMLQAAGRLPEAITEFKEGVRLRPSEAAPMVELATLLLTTNQLEEAVAALHQALRAQPEHPVALATLALIAIGQGDEAGARAWWQRVRRQPTAQPQMLMAIQQAYQQQWGRELR